MKVRNGFVSNSSSSSFIIKKDDLDYEQLEKIRNYYSIAKLMCEQGTSLGYMYGYEESWRLNETDYTIEGSTSMDNFSMYSYLTKFVGINENKIEWDE